MLRSAIRSLFPGLMHRIEEESRCWMVQCRKCGHGTSVWDYGGMRYGGLGPVYRLGRCRGCHRISMLRVYKRDDLPTANIAIACLKGDSIDAAQ